MKQIKRVLYILSIISITASVIVSSEYTQVWPHQSIVDKIEEIAHSQKSTPEKHEAKLFLTYYRSSKNIASLIHYSTAANTSKVDSGIEHNNNDVTSDYNEKRRSSVITEDQSGCDAKHDAQYTLALSLSQDEAGMLPQLKNYYTWKRITNAYSYLSTRLLPLALPILTIFNCSTYFVPYSLSMALGICMKNWLQKTYNEYYDKCRKVNPHPLNSEQLLFPLRHLSDNFTSGSTQLHNNIDGRDNHSTRALRYYTLYKPTTPA